MFPPGIERRTLRVLGVRGNHCATETLRVASDILADISVISEVNLVEGTNKR